MSSEIEWTTSEWDADTKAAYLDGVEASYGYDTYRGIGWEWAVKATSSVSEWPELWDCGSADHEDEAQTAAEESLRQAVAHYAESFKRKQAEREAEKADTIAAWRESDEWLQQEEPEES